MGNTVPSRYNAFEGTGGIPRYSGGRVLTEDSYAYIYLESHTMTKYRYSNEICDLEEGKEHF